MHFNNSINVWVNIYIILVDSSMVFRSDMKEKQEAEKQDWSQPGSTSWADDWTETSDWNPITPNQPDGEFCTPCIVHMALAN